MPPAKMASNYLTDVMDKNGNLMKIERRADGYFNASLMCKSTKKQWVRYFDHPRTAEFLEELSSNLEIAVKSCDGSALIYSKNGGSSPGTWVHPNIVPHLQHWCSNKRKCSPSGYVYAVTSSVLNAVKIGMWRGSIDKLRARYLTPYGPTVQIATAVVDDCLAVEATLHRQFQQYSLGGELFDKQHHQEYLNALQALDDGN